MFELFIPSRHHANGSLFFSCLYYLIVALQFNEHLSSEYIIVNNKNEPRGINPSCTIVKTLKMAVGMSNHNFKSEKCNGSAMNSQNVRTSNI